MAYKRISGIYKIENAVNGKIYIGQSCNLKQRINEHKRNLKNNEHQNNHLQLSYNKYGIENFGYSITEECDENIIDDREIYWIAFYNCCNRNKGYNSEYGGNKNKHHSEESKQRMKNSQKNFTKERLQKMSLSHIGNTHSEETKKKMCDSHKGFTHSEESKLKISKNNSGKERSSEAIINLSKSHIKLNNQEITDIREKYATGEYLQRELAEKYFVPVNIIQYAINNKYKYEQADKI